MPFFPPARRIGVKSWDQKGLWIERKMRAQF